LVEDDGLTLEQIAAKAVEMEQSRIEQAKQSSAQKSAAYFEFKARDFQAWKATRRRYVANYDPAKKAESGKRTKAKMKATRKYSCDICDVAFRNSAELNINKATKNHIIKAAGISSVAKAPQYKIWASASVSARKHYCSICDHAFQTRSKLEMHEATQKHIDKAAS
jgi:hypothetical protein